MTAAIICEYNPFHNGHKYHIEETRKRFGVTRIIGIMSGNFTQRGGVSIIPKNKRTEIALKNGIDLVIELPAAYVLGGAERFAYGAVNIINSLGCVNFLSFGSESGDIDLLGETSGAVHYAEQHEMFFGMMKRGLCYPAALQKTVAQFYDDEISNILNSPNNTLAIEYLKAMNISGSFVKPVTIKRNDGVITASEIRKLLRGSDEDLRKAEKFMPYTAEYLFSEGNAAITRLETAVLAKLRAMSKQDFAELPNILPGLENRLYNASRQACSLSELLFLLKTKRFTLARLRRIVLCAFLGIKKSDTRICPQYVRILGMNGVGKSILADAAKTCPLPVNASLSALIKQNKDSKDFAMQCNTEIKCGNLYALALDRVSPCGGELTLQPVIC